MKIRRAGEATGGFLVFPCPLIIKYLYPLRRELHRTPVSLFWFAPFRPLLKALHQPRIQPPYSNAEDKIFNAPSTAALFARQFTRRAHDTKLGQRASESDHNALARRRKQVVFLPTPHLLCPVVDSGANRLTTIRRAPRFLQG